MTPASPTSRPPLALGEFLRSAGLVQDTQLHAALARQQSSGEKLGDALTRVAAVDAHDTATALMVQKRLREQLALGPQANQEPPTCLRVGELLVAHGDISRAQLDQALQQQAADTPVGTLLVQMGALNAAALERVLKLQKRLLSAVLHAGIGFSFAFVSHTAAAAGNTAQLIISATVLTKINVAVKNQPTGFTLNAQDIARGFVDVPQASEMAITTNSANGVALEFHGMDSGAGIASVQIMGGGSDFRMAPSGGILLLQGGWHPQVPRDLTLHYRLWLSPNAQAGSYAWPLSMSASAL